jgi:DNA-binding winged helix-turn-helix (wHTH) protein/TolB-like protein/Tfp pilus assembly protein PilF
MALAARQLYGFGLYRLDATDRLLYKEDQPVALPPKVMDTLLLLVTSKGRVLGKEDMIKQLWPDTFVEEGTLTQYISLLRRALGDGGAWIENLPRRGYRFTAPVEELLENVSELRIEEHTLSRTVVEEEVVTDKGRSGRFRILAITLALAGVVTAAALLWTRRSEKTAGSFASVAVLPFQMVSDSGNDYLADGMTEALITRLTNVKGLRVVSYSRVRRFKGSSEEAAEAGRRLGVEAVIEGSVRLTSGRIRLSVHAVDTKSGYTIWALDRLEANSANLLDIERQVAESAALKFKGQLTAAERVLIAKSATGNAEAYDLVLKARGALREESATADREAAERMLNRAVQLDPEFVDAYGWLAFAQHQAYQDGHAGPPNLRSAISNASQALSRDPNALIAIRALSYIQHSAGREIEALVAARRALEANPDDLDAVAGAAHAYFRTGLYDRAIPLYRKALAGDPNSREFRRQLARMYLFLGEYEKGIEVISPLSLSQVGPFGMLLYAETGQTGKAIEVLRSSWKRNPNGHMIWSYFGGCVLAAAGDVTGATKVWTEGARNLEARLERHENPYTRSFVALQYAKLGRREQARYHLERSLAHDSSHPVFLFFAMRIRELLGERREALASFKGAVESGFFNLPMIDYVMGPVYVPGFRDDPDFRAIRADLARRVNELHARY